MDEITLRDFRCFHGAQTARLAPLTLVVGENSTGKTSFMAMVRALWEIAHNNVVPDFKEEPYDLGSFAEIAHHRGGRGGRADRFDAGFRADNADVPEGYSFNVTFKQAGTAPVPTVRRVSSQQVSMTAEQSNGTVEIRIGSSHGFLERTVPLRSADETSLTPMFFFKQLAEMGSRSKAVDEQDESALQRLLSVGFVSSGLKPFASAPLRSKPRRTYDPARPSRDPEGDYVPMYLAHLFRHRNRRAWNALKAQLEAFGSAAGLFDEIAIKSLGAHEGEPFQVQVRKQGGRTKGPWRNLIDVGYGVSQVLPLITELLRPDAPSMFLLQQPEVHLHPSAQAALGTLFCHAAQDRQLIVETHSDHLINRVRLDIRDGSSQLSPDDVSILYFERGELEVNIHSLRIDAEGNIVGAPPSYGRFFMEETARSLRH